MSRPAVSRRRTIVALLTAAVLVAGACGSYGDTRDEAAGDVDAQVDDAGSVDGAPVSSGSDGSEDGAAGAAGKGEPLDGAHGAAPFVEGESGCLDTVAAARAQPDPPGDGDALLRRTLDGELPMPPAFDGRQPTVGQVETFDDVDAYFRKYMSVIEAEERRAAMEELGFAGAVDIDHVVGTEVLSVTTLRFASPEDASSYADLHLRRACRDAVGMRALASVSGGVAYIRDSSPPVTKAVFVVGDTEVNLSLCHCVSVDDVIAETEAWAERVAASPSPRA